jgi:hypothetical protein
MALTISPERDLGETPRADKPGAMTMSAADPNPTRAQNNRAVGAAIVGFVVLLATTLGLISWWNDDDKATPMPPAINDGQGSGLVSNHMNDGEFQM